MRSRITRAGRAAVCKQRATRRGRRRAVGEIEPSAATTTDGETVSKVFSARVFGSNLASDSNFQFSFDFMGTKGAATCFPLRRFICVRMACICVCVGCTPESRNMATNAHTHRLQWPRARTLLSNTLTTWLLALTNFFFFAALRSCFWYDLTFMIS
jgi:hypothetical protein